MALSFNAAGKTFPPDKAALLDFKEGLNNDQVIAVLACAPGANRYNICIPMSSQAWLCLQMVTSVSGILCVCALQDADVSNVLETSHGSHQCSLKTSIAIAPAHAGEATARYFPPATSDLELDCLSLQVSLPPG